jgi:site-specific recombinase XerD
MGVRYLSATALRVRPTIATWSFSALQLMSCHPCWPAILPLRSRSAPKSFYRGVAELFERWAARRPSHHTQRAYRRDVLNFVDFLGLIWPQDAFRLLLASVADVQRWRDAMMAASKAPKTLNRRISSLSSFYKYLAGAAAELRLPVNLPNPAHAQFIARESSDPLEGTRALTATRARQLMGLPAGDDVLDFRDRAILKTYLYTGVRLATACRLRVRRLLQTET